MNSDYRYTSLNDIEEQEDILLIDETNSIEQDTPIDNNTKKGPTLGFLFQNLFVDIICPIILFFSLQPVLGPTLAIIISAIPPALSTCFSIIVFKRIEAVPIIGLCSISITSIFTLLYDNPKFNLIPDALIPFGIGLGYIITLNSRRPLFYYFARPWITQNNPTKMEEFDRKWDQLNFRKDMKIISISWGVGLILRGVSWGIFVYLFQVSVLLIINPIIGLGIMVPLGAWSSYYVNKKLNQFKS